MNSLFDIAGRTAVVTGSSRGIGKAICEELLQAGVNVIGISRSQHEVQTHTGNHLQVSADLSRREEVRALPSVCRDLAMKRDWDPISILVNNAGIIRRADAVDYPEIDWDDVVETDLTAPFLLAQAFAPSMISHRQGAIIFVASLLSFQGGIRVPAYTAAKSGLRGVVSALANEWASFGVNVNGIAPGYIATDNTRALREDDVRYHEILNRIPAARWGDPSDLVGAVHFLCSPAAKYVHGHILAVDGGWLGR